MIIEIHGLLLLHSLVDDDPSHVHAQSRVARHPTLHHLLLHVYALNLYQILHVLLRRYVLKLTFCLLLILWGLALLQLELHVVEDTIEIDRIQLDGHLDGWVLLEMYQRCLSLFGVYHARNTFNTLAFIQSNLFSIENHQLNKSFDYNHAIVGLSSNWIVD